MYLTVDFTIICDVGGTWGMYVFFAGIPATVVFIFGIPILLLSLLFKARRHNVKRTLDHCEKVHRLGERNTLMVREQPTLAASFSLFPFKPLQVIHSW
jgi:hypothetical protein